MVEDFCTRAQVRFSAFFHGHSVLTRERYATPHVKTEAMHSYRPRVTIAEDGLRRDGPVPRSRTSTRSLIDPISPPMSTPGSPQTEELWHYRGAFYRPVLTPAPDPRVETQIDHRSRGSFPARHEGPSLARNLKEEQRCLPTVTDRHIKYKIIGSLISGTLLVLLLTVCGSLVISLEVSADTLSRSRPGSLRLDFRPIGSRRHDRLHPIYYHALLPFLDPTLHAESSPSEPHKTSYQGSA